MAITLPTAAQLKAVYPEFADIDDTVVDAAIVAAGRSVDEYWLAGDQQPAIIHLAAHYLAASGVQASATEDGGPPVKSETIGRISITYGDAASSAKLESTNYGNMYLSFFRRNRKPGFVI